jgi:flagellin-like protein
MNVLGHRERSWRKARKRAVSPIIATILLVAITVVLAAVLYVLISGLTHGPGSTPIGSAFTAGNPVSSTVSGAAAAACAAGGANPAGGHYIYTLTIESSTVTFGSVFFQVKTSAGAVAAPAAYEGFFVESVSSAVVACAITTANGGLSMGTAAPWIYTTAGGLSPSSPLTNLYTIVVDVGTASPTGQGYTFNALGTGSYSGTTGALSLP